MNILITNQRLSVRAGTELFGHMLARGLEARGHSVMVYSSDLREGERMLGTDLIPVATELAALPFAPDIIHAQHHLDVMSALAALPHVPAVFHVRDPVWRGGLVEHPRIYRYLNSSRHNAASWKISPARIEIFPCEIDFARLIVIYENVIALHQAARTNPHAELLAISRYLQRLVPLIKTTDDALGRDWSAAAKKIRER